MSDVYDQSYPPSLWLADPVEPEPPAGDDEPEPEPEADGDGDAAAAFELELGPFDPADHTIAEVQAYVTDNPDETTDVLAAEAARGDQARTTLVAWLEDRTT